MKNFFVLMRLAVQQTFRVGSGGRKKKVKVVSAVTSAVLYVLLGLLIAAMMGFVYVGMVLTSAENGTSVYACVTVANLLGSALMLFLATMGLAAHVFKCRDFDFLMSLPVTPTQILWSKLVGQYVTLLYYSLTFVLPAYIVVFAFGNVEITLLGVLSAVLNILVVPMIPLAVAVILAFFVSLIPENKAFGKVVSTLLSLVLIGLYMWFFYGGNGMTQLMTNPAITNAMKKVYFPLGFLDKALGGSLVSLLLYILVCVGICALVVGLLSLIYFPIIRARKTSGGKRKKFEKSDVRASRVGAALYKKELKKYFGTTAYVVNTVVGPLLFVAGAIYCVYGGSYYMAMLSNAGAGVAIPVAFLLQSFMLGMGCTTAASVSLEGKSLWILRSAPVSAKSVFAAKIGVGLTVLLPFSIAGSAVLVFGFGLDAVSGIAVFLSGVLLPFIISFLGLLVGLRFPRFDSVNEAQAIKQGLAPLLGMFLPMLILLPFVVLSFLLVVFGVFVGTLAVSLLMLAVEVIFLAVVTALLATKGTELYNRL